ncbi:hypothetical protein BCR39DRAFT_556019 [Naematelia encephala]|uniref:Uncharacterized protein n=1 Tax=Naematelia encephala TaxID=71784 RepID=A0A1Y2BMD0_9TREE|nr:hypothetical protein BCR39DRAFT_556019 [Naematelia encephala]
MPATRRSTRHVAQQPHSSLLPSSLHTGVPTGEPESWASASTATLPTRYTIAIALPTDQGPLDVTRGYAEYVRGEEALSDAWRRNEEAEGRVLDLRSKRFVRHIDDSACQPSQPTRDDNKALWYTAGLSYLCICKLEDVRRAYSPALPPPTIDTLPSLSPVVLPDCLPLVHILPNWSTDLSADLDPPQDQLEEFDLSWRDADGSGWGAQASCDDLEPQDSQAPLIHEPDEVSRIRKGKFKAVDPVTPSGGLSDLAESESWKVRRAYWRKLISDDAGYGQIWSIIPRPHHLNPSPLAKPRTNHPPTPPDYILPRALVSSIAPGSTPSHPYHPDLRMYISSNPTARLYWLIPLHGPVIIPTLLSTSAKVPTSTTTTSSKIPTPSYGEIVDSLPSDTASDPKVRPAPIIWTSALLRYIWQSFLVPLVSQSPVNAFGHITIRLSGPKPDPFLALLPPPPLDRHMYFSGDTATRPERVEAGDHLRIYVDAKKALALRTWLHGIEIPGNIVRAQKGKEILVEEGKGSERSERGQEKGDIWRPFHKVRLCLIGEKGEVLVVA